MQKYGIGTGVIVDKVHVGTHAARTDHRRLVRRCALARDGRRRQYRCTRDSLRAIQCSAIEFSVDARSIVAIGNSRFGAAWQDYAASSVAMSKLHLYLRDASTTNASLQTSQWAGGGETVDGCALLFDSSTVVLNGIENVFGFVLLLVRE
jgi:hypothetical protein